MVGNDCNEVGHGAALPRPRRPQARAALCPGRNRSGGRTASSPSSRLCAGICWSNHAPTRPALIRRVDRTRTADPITHQHWPEGFDGPNTESRPFQLDCPTATGNDVPVSVGPLSNQYAGRDMSATLVGPTPAGKDQQVPRESTGQQTRCLRRQYWWDPKI